METILEKFLTLETNWRNKIIIDPLIQKMNILDKKYDDLPDEITNLKVENNMLKIPVKVIRAIQS